MQLGMVADYQPSLVRMRLFLATKQPHVSNVSLVRLTQPQGYRITQSRETIASLIQGQQEPIDVNMAIDSCIVNTPVFQLSYSSPTGEQVAVPVRLPLSGLKLGVPLPQVNFPGLWASLEMSEQRLKFDIDFSQCKSLTQLKEVLKQASRNAFTFAESDAKNVVCGGLMMPRPCPVHCLVKLSMTVDGRGCELLGRSEDLRFARQTLTNILELIALPHLS